MTSSFSFFSSSSLDLRNYILQQQSASVSRIAVSIVFLVILHFFPLGNLSLTILTTFPISILIICWLHSYFFLYIHSLIFSILHSLLMFVLHSWFSRFFPLGLSSSAFSFLLFLHISDLSSIWSCFRDVSNYWSYYGFIDSPFYFSL